MAKSKFFRVAVEGATTDGRVIDRSWLQQIAAAYNTTKFGARIWLEHIRGILPDSPFKAYGDVVAVKAEEIDIDGTKKMALFAQIDATDELVAMNKKRQKIYTSMELDPNFAKSGQAYLVGLAVTDSPASLGTEQLAFAAGAKINPLAERKQNPENVFSVAQEVTLEFDDEKPAEGESLFAKVMGLLKGKDKSDVERFADAGKAIEAVAAAQRDLLDKFSALQAELATATAQIKAATDAATADRKAFADLKALLDKEPKDGQRPPAAGGNAGATATDC
jgi:hypothetical protein